MIEASDDSDLEPIAKPTTQHRRSGIRIFLNFVALLVLLVAVLSRSSTKVSQEVAVLLLKVESETGYQLPFIKSFFGIRLFVSPEVAAERIVRGDLLSLTALLRGGLNSNGRTSAGDPLLFVAVATGRQELVAKLLDFGADSNALAMDGNTPLLLATQMENIALVSLLAKAGADLNLQNAFGESALILAVKSENSSLVQQLLNLGANVNLRDKKGSSPLLIAAAQNNETLVDALLNQGAKPLESEVSDEQFLQKLRRVALSERALPFTNAENAPEEFEIPSSGESNAEPLLDESLPAAETEPLPAPRPARTMTRLRVLGAPTGTWTRNKQLTLESVEVTIKNAGSFEAQDIVVKVVVPGGEVVDLNGPTTMKPNSQARFTAQPATIVTKNGSLSPKVFCSNCRS